MASGSRAEQPILSQSEGASPWELCVCVNHHRALTEHTSRANYRKLLENRQNKDEQQAVAIIVTGPLIASSALFVTTWSHWTDKKLSAENHYLYTVGTFPTFSAPNKLLSLWALAQLKRLNP